MKMVDCSKKKPDKYGSSSLVVSDQLTEYAQELLLDEKGQMGDTTAL